MDRQQLMKMVLLVLAVLTLAYVVSLYSKKQDIHHSGLVDRFESDRILEEYAEVKRPPCDENEGYKAVEDPNDPLKEICQKKSEEEFTNPGEIQAAEASGNNEVYHKLNSNSDTGKFGLSGNQYPKDCFPKDQLSPGELLPGDANSKWSQSVPAGQGELGDQNFLTAGYHVGVNTVGQTLRNANRQLRSEPPNPQVKVSPWLQTTIETDANRRPLEIGGCE